MAAGDVLLDAAGNRVLYLDGNVVLSDGTGDDCCCLPLPSSDYIYVIAQVWADVYCPFPSPDNGFTESFDGTWKLTRYAFFYFGYGRASPDDPTPCETAKAAALAAVNAALFSGAYAYLALTDADLNSGWIPNPDPRISTTNVYTLGICVAPGESLGLPGDPDKFWEFAPGFTVDMEPLVPPLDPADFPLIETAPYFDVFGYSPHVCPTGTGSGSGSGGSGSGSGSGTGTGTGGTGSGTGTGTGGSGTGSGSGGTGTGGSGSGTGGSGTGSGSGAGYCWWKHIYQFNCPLTTVVTDVTLTETFCDTISAHFEGWRQLAFDGDVVTLEHWQRGDACPIGGSPDCGSPPTTPDAPGADQIAVICGGCPVTPPAPTLHATFSYFTASDPTVRTVTIDLAYGGSYGWYGEFFPGSPYSDEIGGGAPMSITTPCPWQIGCESVQNKSSGPTQDGGGAYPGPSGGNITFVGDVTVTA